MQYLKYTYVDAETGLPISRSPVGGGPAMPSIEGLHFEFALESKYPTDVPEFFGTCPDESDPTISGVLDVLTQEQYEAARQAEMDARKHLLIASMTASVQQHMDSTATTKGYDGIQSAALRAALPSSPFHSEGVAYGEWMDSCWARCYQILAEVEAGQRAQPTAEDLIAELPELVLPA